MSNPPTISVDWQTNVLARETAHAVSPRCNFESRGQHSPSCVHAADIIENNMIALVAHVLGSTAEVMPRLAEYDLKKMMRDPRYWRDQEPEIVERVRAGFRKLYSEDTPDGDA